MPTTSVPPRPTGRNGKPRPPLGTTCKIVFHRESSLARSSIKLPEESVARRFCLQSGARDLLPHERVSSCCRSLVFGSVQVLHSPSLNRAVFSGLATCASVWMCPVCAARISEHRRRELASAVAEWRRLGGRVLLVSYTVRHTAGDVLETCLQQLLRARKLWKSGRFSQEFRDYYEVAGTIFSLEVTHGSNGWHPHIHELVFLTSRASADEVQEVIAARWMSVVSAAGMPQFTPDMAHGVDVRDADAEVADYVAKFGSERQWGEVEEVTKAVTKAGRAGNRGPMGLLADYCLGDGEAGRLWKEYALHFKGHKQLVWSQGLRALLLPQVEEKEDAEIAGDVSDYPVLLAEFTLQQWRVILANDARGDVLAVAGRGDEGRLWAYLERFGLSKELDPSGRPPARCRGVPGEGETKPASQSEAFARSRSE